MTERLLQKEDLPGIRDIARVSFPLLWTEEQFSYFLTHECGYNYGVWEADRLTSYLIALLVRGDLDVISIATHPDFRRKGLAKRLIEKAQGDPRVNRLHLEVEVTNQPAVKLYEGLGLRVTRVRKKYYEGARDASEMAWERK